ncbi:MAG: hypothetical protein KJO79_05395, partial [Verrucomicrobiae bacterium]|nr:hypothetical protein [Verrucomicrobiae bacterium]NNJ86595.1 hypothetical protein [Akkermansiaceae bacterium]
MDPLQSWLDAKEVRRMAESLMAPSPAVDQSAVDAGYGDDFEGFAETPASDSVGSNKDLDSDLVARPDGRPHAQRQFMTTASEADAPPSVGVSDKGDPPQETPKQRTTVGDALADAKRMAEGSGMLAGGDADQQAATAGTASHQHAHDSPFKVSTNQHQSETDPLAYQVDSEANDTKLDVWDDENTGRVAASATGDLSKATPTFQPETQSSLPKNPTPAASGAGNDRGRSAESAVVSDSGSVARGPFLTRLQRFSEILRRDLDAQAMFLIDND